MRGGGGEAVGERDGAARWKAASAEGGARRNEATGSWYHGNLDKSKTFAQK